MYIRYICTFHMCMQHGIGNATTAIQGFRSLWITSTRVTCFSVHNASVLPMHGFESWRANVHHNDGGWTHLVRKATYVHIFHNRVIVNQSLYGWHVALWTTRPWGVLQFSRYGRKVDIMHTVPGLNSYLQNAFATWNTRFQTTQSMSETGTWTTHTDNTRDNNIWKNKAR